MEQSKQSSDNTRQTNILPELQPGVTCAPKAPRKLTETSSFPGQEDREHSVCNHLQNANKTKPPTSTPYQRGKNKCQPPVELGGASRRLSSPTLLLCLFWDWSHTENWGQPGSLHHWCKSPAIVLQLLYWFYFLGPWHESWWHIRLPSDCLGGHRRSPALVIFPAWQQNN